jgi:hypothetical protein
MSKYEIQDSKCDPEFLSPFQLKIISEIDEKVKKCDYSDFVDFDVMKKKILNKRISNVRIQNRIRKCR